MATSDRKPYESATTLDQAFLDDCHDNLTNQLELIVDIETPDGTIYVSDRNKYVGGTFYEARLKFPTIKRTIGEYLAPTMEFSTLTLEINNVDGAYSHIMPAGADYDGWIGRSVVVKMGLRDVESTYQEIFRGKITHEGGFQRSVSSFTITARNDFDRLNEEFPTTAFKSSTYPDIDPEQENKIVPVIYGDWTVNLESDAASIPAFPVNGANPHVNEDGDDEETHANANTELLELVISSNENLSFDTDHVYVQRSDIFYKFDPADVVSVGVGNNSFSLRQANTTPACVSAFEDGELFKYKVGDKFFVRVKGKDLGAYSDNLVAQAKDILETYAGMDASEFDTSWETYRDKATPAESAISDIKSRAWIQDRQGVLTYALSMLEQVRLEAFINRSFKLQINALHLEDFEPSPSFTLRNWDIEQGSFRLKIDDRNNFNRAQGTFNFLPSRNENYQETAVYKNETAITQMGRAISKRIVFPNLYVASDVENQVQEILKITSSNLEFVELTATWRSMLLDIGDFVKINVNIQGTVFESVPALIREIGYDPNGIKLPITLWSFMMLPFPGWSPGYSGITGGDTATITEEG